MTSSRRPAVLGALFFVGMYVVAFVVLVVGLSLNASPILIAVAAFLLMLGLAAGLIYMTVWRSTRR